MAMIIEPGLAARSCWFTNLRALNVSGRNLHRRWGPLLTQWFGFDQSPEPWDEPKGVVYRNGEFSPSGAAEDLIGIELTVYPDGLLAKTATTTVHTDLFLATLLERLARENVLAYAPERISHKRYGTDWIVRPEVPLPQMEQFADFCRFLAGML